MATRSSFQRAVYPVAGCQVCSIIGHRRWIRAKNALGRVAIVLATSFNAQHQLGQDQNGAPGGDFSPSRHLSSPPQQQEPVECQTGGQHHQCRRPEYQ
ncbi:hypothetical protein ACFS07_22525 [Undibacterium arcticum]